MEAFLNRFELYRLYTDDFNFNRLKPSFFSFEAVVWVVTSYLICIRLAVAYMKQEVKPFQLKYISAIHNFFLFALSIVMFLGVMTNVIYLYFYRPDNTLHDMLCDTKDYLLTGKLNFWIYVFYLSKPYEFVDTFIQIFKKKQPNFLHVWHHCTTFLLVWICQVTDSSIQWVSIAVNSFIHILMYYYYFASTLGIPVWWKRYLTQLQIAQFAITVMINNYWGYVQYTGQPCHGTLSSWLFGIFIIGSFFLLFLQFYFDSYTKSSVGDSPRSSPHLTKRD